MYTELSQRLAERESLLEMRQQLRNQLHALTHNPTVISSVRTRMESLLETLTEQIDQVDRELEAALEFDATWAASAQRLQTINGIGPLTASWLLVTTLNFTLCQTVEELTAYAGLAPHAYQSGTSVHGRASIGHTGNASLRTALYLATLSAAQHNPLIKSFYDRLRTAGKPIKVARCAAARKLLHLAYALVKPVSPFLNWAGTLPKGRTNVVMSFLPTDRVSLSHPKGIHLVVPKSFGYRVLVDCQPALALKFPFMPYSPLTSRIS